MPSAKELVEQKLKQKNLRQGDGTNVAAATAVQEPLASSAPPEQAAPPAAAPNLEEWLKDLPPDEDELAGQAGVISDIPEDAYEVTYDATLEINNTTCFFVQGELIQDQDLVRSILEIESALLKKSGEARLLTCPHCLKAFAIEIEPKKKAEETEE
jgi:hypothetical protein